MNTPRAILVIVLLLSNLAFLLLIQRNTFQAVVTSDGQQTFVLYIYGQLEWYRANTGQFGQAQVRAQLLVRSMTPFG